MAKPHGNQSDRGTPDSDTTKLSDLDPRNPTDKRERARHIKRYLANNPKATDADALRDYIDGCKIEAALQKGFAKLGL
jgi:hypothetical protein